MAIDYKSHNNGLSILTEATCKIDFLQPKWFFKVANLDMNILTHDQGLNSNLKIDFMSQCKITLTIVRI